MRPVPPARRAHCHDAGICRTSLLRSLAERRLRSGLRALPRCRVDRGARPASRTAGMAAAPATRSGKRADIGPCVLRGLQRQGLAGAAAPALPLPATILSSAHQPVARLRQDAEALEALRRSHAVLAVSNSQGQDLLALNLGVPVHALPHGVWSRVFQPTATGPAVRDHVLIVGSFLRDWDAARRVATDLTAAGVRSVALGAGARSNLAAAANVEVSGWVPEHELADRYHHAAAVFLPFLEATASNALLEAMAAGCPVICPRLPSLVDEYPGRRFGCVRSGPARRGGGASAALRPRSRRTPGARPGAACPGSAIRLGALAGSRMRRCSRRCRRPLPGATTQDRSMGASRYNEGFDGDGRLRAAYRAFEARTGRDLLRSPLPKTGAPAAIGNRYPIVPVPLVLADQEYAALAEAVRQRALALQRLFLDLVRGIPRCSGASACRRMSSTRNPRFRRRRA